MRIRHIQSPGRRWGASRLPPAAGDRRRASGRGQQIPRSAVDAGRCRVPQQENIFAPTPRMKPSAYVKLEPILSCSIRTKFYKLGADSGRNNALRNFEISCYAGYFVDAEMLILAWQVFPYWRSQSAYHLLPTAHGDLYPHSPYRPYAQPPH